MNNTEKIRQIQNILASWSNGEIEPTDMSPAFVTLEKIAHIVDLISDEQVDSIMEKPDQTDGDIETLADWVEQEKRGIENKSKLSMVGMPSTLS